MDCSALNSRSVVGRVLALLDNRMLELIGLEVGDFSISHPFQILQRQLCVGLHKGVWPHSEKEMRRLFERIGGFRGFME